MVTQTHARAGQPPRVLVVEDEFLIALDVAEVLREMGCEVVGPANDLRTAMRLMRSVSPDLAVIDLNLGRGMGGETLVRLLEASGCRCLVLSGDATCWPASRPARWCRNRRRSGGSRPRSTGWRVAPGSG